MYDHVKVNEGNISIMKQEFTQIKTAIIASDSAVRQQLEDSLDRQQGFSVVATASTGSQAIQDIQSKLPDLIIVDVELPQMDGFDLLQKVPPAIRPQFVFLSSKPDDAVRAFDYFASDFLLKPVAKDRLELTLIRVRDQIYQKGNAQLHEKLNALFRYINPAKQSSGPQTNGNAKLLPVKMSGRIYFLHPGDIEFVEAAGYYIEVFANGKKHLIRQSLTQLEEHLDSRHFVRIHRSVIINLKYLKEIIRDGANDFSVRMSNDASFKISRSYKSDVFEKIGL